MSCRRLRHLPTRRAIPPRSSRPRHDCDMSWHDDDSDSVRGGGPAGRAGCDSVVDVAWPTGRGGASHAGPSSLVAGRPTVPMRALAPDVSDDGNYFALEGNAVEGAMELICESHNAPERDVVYRMPLLRHRRRLARMDLGALSRSRRDVRGALAARPPARVIVSARLRRPHALGLSRAAAPMPLVELRRGIADPVVALTFDDGPSSWTLPIADHLERHGGRGTFFAIGEAVATDCGGAIVRRLLDRGHEVGNHTWTHPDLQTLDEPEVHEEMRRTSEALAQVGVATRLWRAPFFPATTGCGPRSGTWRAPRCGSRRCPATGSSRPRRRPGASSPTSPRRHRRPPRRPPGAGASRAVVADAGRDRRRRRAGPGADDPPRASRGDDLRARREPLSRRDLALLDEPGVRDALLRPGQPRLGEEIASSSRSICFRWGIRMSTAG